MSSNLTPFEGRDVVQSTIKVTNAGDGLSEALAVEPVEMHHGEKRYLLIEAEVTRVHYDEIKDTDVLRRVHTLRAGTATLVDEDWAIPAIAEQKRRNLEAKGVHALSFEDDDVIAFLEGGDDDE